MGAGRNLAALGLLFTWTRGTVYNEKIHREDGCALLLVWGTGDLGMFIFYFCCRHLNKLFPFPPSTAKLIDDFRVNRLVQGNDSSFL